MKKFTLLLVLLVAGLGAAYWFKWPPFTEQSALETEIEAEKPFPDKPPFRFSSRALSGICDEYGINCEQLLEKMEGLGIEAEARWSIKRIAEENDMETGAVFETIRQLK
jgi:hypothetical protein